MSQDIQHLEQIWRLILQCKFGVLATQFHENPQYPFGSVVPFCGLPDNALLILISHLAVHTKNIDKHPCVALTLLDPQLFQMGSGTPSNVQSYARLTILADVTPLENLAESESRRYYRCFPDAVDFHRTHNFFFYRVQPTKYRMIGGFGQIRWLHPTPKDPLFILDTQEEEQLLAEISANFSDFCKKMNPQQYQQPLPTWANQENLIGVDRLGLDFLTNNRLYRFEFSQSLNV